MLDKRYQKELEKLTKLDISGMTLEHRLLMLDLYAYLQHKEQENADKQA